MCKNQGKYQTAAGMKTKKALEVFDSQELTIDRKRQLRFAKI